MSNDRIIIFAYQGFIDSWVGSKECDDFLKEILPEKFYESIHDEHWDNDLDYDSAYFIKSFIKMCGLSVREIPQFDRYECESCTCTLYGHNDLYRFEIEYRLQIKYDNVTLRFYHNDGKHFLTLKTVSNCDGTTGFFHRYDWLVRQCLYEDYDKPKVFRIGGRGVPEVFGFFVIAWGTVYFCPYIHEEILSEEEDFNTFYKSIKESRSKIGVGM